jgi:DNA-directed RNA polymerase subunit F
MLKEQEPLSMPEVFEFLDKEKESDIKGFIKKFNNLSSKDAKDLRKRLEGMDLMKMKKEHIVKIIDMLPDNKEDLNKIFVDIGLDENEIEKIISTVKEFK